MAKKELKLLGFKMKPIGKEGDKILGREFHENVGKVYVDKNNRVIVKSKNKKIKEKLQKGFKEIGLKNTFYIKKDGKKIYKKPGDPKFLEALKGKIYLVAGERVDGYAIIGSFREFKKERPKFLNKIISFFQGKKTKKLKIIGFKEKSNGEEIKETIGEIYIDKNNKIVIKAKNEKIKKALRDKINQSGYKKRGVILRGGKIYLREDGSVEGSAQTVSFKKPGDLKFLEAIRESALDFDKKIDGWRINYLCCRVVKE